MISVCIATYNGERFIVEQLQSILIQLSGNDEIIISDDHSADSTVDLIKSINDSRIKLYYNSNEKGYAKNFENAINKANGNIIMLSDQDDIWVDYKVKVTIDFLQQYDFVVSDATVVNEQLQVLYPSHFSMHGVKKGFIKNFINTRYIGACMSFKAEILKKALPFPRNQKYCAHDYWLTLIAERFYNTGLIYEPLVLYRRHSNNVLTGGIISTNSLFKKIYTRAYCLINLVFRYGK